MDRFQLYTRIVFLVHLFLYLSDSSMNIAKDKSATQSSTYENWTADRAVDGEISTQNDSCDCCAHTVGQKNGEAWWQVDLSTLSTIQTIKIYYRRGWECRFAGFSVYVSNSSEVKEVLCYDDRLTGILPNINQTIQCNHAVRYVYIYNERDGTYPEDADCDKNLAFLELCEVEVYGCPFTTYGTNCSNNCSSGCNDESYICDPDTGNCFSGCKDNFIGLQCNVCVDGRYGEHCELACPSNCFNDTCVRDSGDCTFGCQNNFNGSKCDVCSTGFYGTSCDKNCPIGCVDLVCDGIDGQCILSCKDGFSGSNCDVCVTNRYGENCQNNCSINCLNSTCNDTSGDCIFGCELNYNGTKCYVCVDGKYGERCDVPCPSNCLKDICDRNTGDCTSGCENNFNGSTCEECITNRYGTECQHNCSANCKDKQCQRTTGKCSNGCSDGWEGGICNVPISPARTSTGESVQTSTIVGVAIGSIVALVAVIVVLIFMKRRFVGVPKYTKNSKNILDSTQDISTIHQNMPDSHELKENTREHVICSAAKDETNVIYANTTAVYSNINLSEIPVKELRQHQARKTKQHFEEEYKKLADGAQFSHTHASKPENKLKNRFKRPYCYDHSRVVLKSIVGQPDSDFINANYIDGVEHPKFYIATQGPTINTVNDFWRMIWEVNSSVIVMLTNLIEMGKVKCEQYWPDIGEILSVDYLLIKVEDVKAFVGFSLRKIFATNTRDNTSRKILQYHFTSWPDHGTPDHTEIILFQRQISAQYSEITGPIIVHCSAGIGRTGTFIALDALLQYGNRTGRIGILDFIKSMRQNRVNMIQNLDQYIFLNEVMVEAFEHENTRLTRQDINDIFEQSVNTSDEGVMETKYLHRIQKEFQDLQLKKKSYGDKDYKTALAKPNKTKNKENCPLALEACRPFVNARLPGEPNYINAVILSAFNKKDGYMVSHTPMPNTYIDLWSVIVDHQCETLVIFDIDASEKSERWLPLREDEIIVGPFTIENEGEQETKNEYVKMCSFSVSEKETESRLKIKAYIISSWTKGTLISSKPQFMKLIGLVDERLQSKDSGIITVLCPIEILAK